MQIDVPTVFADKVMKAALKHIEIIAKARQKGLYLAVNKAHKTFDRICRLLQNYTGVIWSLMMD